MHSKNDKTDLKAINQISVNIPDISPMISSLNELRAKLAPFSDSCKQMSENAAQALGAFSKSLQESIPNMRTFSEASSNLILPFCKAVEELMRTLDFPVIQPEITREQLADRLEQMDDKEFDAVKKHLTEVSNTIPLQQNEKFNLKKKVHKVWETTKKIIAVAAAVDAIFSLCEHTADFIKYISSKVESHTVSVDDVQKDANSGKSYQESYSESKPFIATVTSDIADHIKNQPNSK